MGFTYMKKIQYLKFKFNLYFYLLNLIALLKRSVGSLVSSVN